MNVLLDTNILRADIGVRSGRFDVLRDYIHRTQSRILVPQLVYDEIRAVYSRELAERVGKAASAAAAVLAFMPHRPSGDAVLPQDTAVEVAAYSEYLLEQLGISHRSLLPSLPGYLTDMLDRAVWRRPPCTSRGEELRDVVIWLATLDAAVASTDKRVAFISANVRQFAGENGELHPELEKEARERGVTVHFFTSLDDFARQHASQFDFITSAWIKAAIPELELLDAAEWSIRSVAESRLESALESGERAAGEVRLHNMTVTGVEWYVNELGDGSLRIEILYVIDSEAEGPIWRGVWRQRSPRKYDGSTAGDGWVAEPEPELVTEPGFASISIECEVVVEGVIRDQKLMEWEVSHADST